MTLAHHHIASTPSTSVFSTALRLAPDPSTPLAELPESERHRLIAQELDALKARIFKQLGEEDVLYVKKLHRFSRSMEALGRVLLHVSMDPVTFSAGVVALWVHKQLQATEIGHSALHGVYDKLPGGEAFASKTFRWDTPIDEASWRLGHNVKHHGNTNVAGKDPDIHFGPVRLTSRTPHKLAHYAQLPFTLGVLFPNFGVLMNLHFTGLLDAYADNGQPETLDFLPDRTLKSRLGAWRRALRKYVPYYAKNYVFYPALAGPFFAKVLLGNVLAEVMRDVYSAATIYCGHVGDDVAHYEHGTKAGSRGEWYAMQIASSNDFEVARPISILCGGLDRQIEHHLFPTLPPERLRQIAPEVRAICERHGIAYKTASWPATLKKSLSQIARLSKKGGLGEVLRSMA
jgi:fatty acid desaturase